MNTHTHTRTHTHSHTHTHKHTHAHTHTQGKSERQTHTVLPSETGQLNARITVNRQIDRGVRYRGISRHCINATLHTYAAQTHRHTHAHAAHTHTTHIGRGHSPTGC